MFIKPAELMFFFTSTDIFCLQGTRMPMSYGGKIFNFEGGAIDQGIHFQIAPGVFDRVEFWCIGRQEARMETARHFNESPGAFGAMSVEAIPEQHACDLHPKNCTKIGYDFGV